MPKKFIMDFFLNMTFADCEFSMEPDSELISVLQDEDEDFKNFTALNVAFDSEKTVFNDDPNSKFGEHTLIIHLTQPYFYTRVLVQLMGKKLQGS